MIWHFITDISYDKAFHRQRKMFIDFMPVKMIVNDRATLMFSTIFYLKNGKFIHSERRPLFNNELVFKWFIEIKMWIGNKLRCLLDAV